MQSVSANVPPTFGAMRQEVAGCVRTLAERVDPILTACEPRAAKALHDVEDLQQHLQLDNALDVKRQMRGALWELRQRLEEGPPTASALEIRIAVEKTRNACFDLSLERMYAIPSQFYEVRPPISQVPNFGCAAPGVLRGGQVDTDGAAWLVAHGVRAEIDLRGDDRDNAWTVPEWGPIKHYPIPVDDLKVPTFAQVEAFIREVEDPANQPVFVHCKAGVGRTGTMIACWRITKGWTADDAIADERLRTYDGSLSQESFIRSFEQYWKQRPH